MLPGRMWNGESRSATRLGERTDADCGGAPSPGCCVMPPQLGGKFRPRLNTGERPIANKYREGKMKRTLKRESKSA
ncbi:TPA_asm: hypothetical protein HUJ06_031894 [Nelumbo nucifera]|uniref:Uncharacterized protein n=1 Tax=Nelumbo nucifera TaxID=4432 RepID=A0A823A200_NELNU|nr:TPA_asm: hypothetical protein HUJ06_031894 [Nelumbo nucifera]